MSFCFKCRVLYLTGSEVPVVIMQSCSSFIWVILLVHATGSYSARHNARDDFDEFEDVADAYAEPEVPSPSASASNLHDWHTST